MDVISRKVVENRRFWLKKWIDANYEGSQAAFIEATGINQGELSGLLRTKSFGEKKARALEKQSGMPVSWLDQPQNTIENVPLPVISEDILKLSKIYHRILPLYREQWLEKGEELAALSDQARQSVKEADAERERERERAKTTPAPLKHNNIKQFGEERRRIEEDRRKKHCMIPAQHERRGKERRKR